MTPRKGTPSKTADGVVDREDFDFASATLLQETFSSRFDSSRPYGVDYYGIPNLKRLVADLPGPQPVVALLFLDALADAAVHSYGSPELKACLRLKPPFIINSYNLNNTPEANLSHTHPQVILGVCSDWSEPTLLMLTHFTEQFFALLAGRCDGDALSALGIVVERLNADADLLCVDFTPVDCAIPDQVRDAYLRGLANVALRLRAR